MQRAWEVLGLIVQLYLLVITSSSFTRLECRTGQRVGYTALWLLVKAFKMTIL